MQPYVLSLEAGDHYFCSCGNSRNPPYCDGAHQGTGKNPHAVTLGQPQTVYVCGCGRSGKTPYCDGTHKG